LSTHSSNIIISQSKSITIIKALKESEGAPVLVSSAKTI
jgi:hypothetical protein